RLTLNQTTYPSRTPKANNILHSAFYILHSDRQPWPFGQAIAFTLHPSPFTLHPSPFTLQPSTLNLQP
ncbi:MAG: hypothetical protein F6J98_43620, partial [Moorea sp. SIO4G2]|nr:hypothetical protein [Moorena sp. SIO4G2]